MLIGIDIGGTTIKVGLITEFGKIIDRHVINTPHVINSQDTKDIAASIKAFVEEAETKLGEAPAALQEIDAIGIAVPGIVDAANNIRMTPNVTLDLAAFIAALQECFPGATISALNDANAAALGEQKFGAGEDSENMVFVTLGTGVGGGIVVNNQLLIGREGGAGEIGHITVDEEGLECGCGRKGCLELYCSSRGIVWLYKEALKAAKAKPVEYKELHFDHDAHAKPVFDAAREGDAIALQAINDMAGYLASALSTIACVLDPQAFIIGGGISASFDLFGPVLAVRYQAVALPAQKDIPIRKAQLENDAGMLGAAHFAHQRKLP